MTTIEDMGTRTGMYFLMMSILARESTAVNISFDCVLVFANSFSRNCHFPVSPKPRTTYECLLVPRYEGHDGYGEANPSVLLLPGVRMVEERTNDLLTRSPSQSEIHILLANTKGCTPVMLFGGSRGSCALDLLPVHSSRLSPRS